MINKVGILLPELVIHNVLVSIITLLRTDLQENSSDETESILYKILGLDEEEQPIQLNLYNYFKQAKKILLTEHNLSINFGYNQEVANMISLHILLPSETGKVGIGADEGYMNNVDENETLYNGYYTAVYESTYQIMITSNNSAEVNVVYTILKSMLLMLIDQLELFGLRLPSISGNDIVMQDDLTPVPIFHKVLNLTFTYEHNVPQRLQRNIIKKFAYLFRIVEPYPEPEEEEPEEPEEPEEEEQEEEEQ